MQRLGKGMKHVIVAHRYEHARWFIAELRRELKMNIIPNVVIDRVQPLHGLINATVYVLNASRAELTQRERENRYSALEILAPQSHRITIKEIDLP